MERRYRDEARDANSVALVASTSSPNWGPKSMSSGDKTRSYRNPYRLHQEAP